MTRLRNRVIALVLAIVVVGCAGPTSQLTAPPSWADPGTVRYSCDEPPGFLPALFDKPGTAEQEDHPSAAALRDFLASDSFGMGFLPDAGWWLVQRDDRKAQYIARLPDGNETPFGNVTLQLTAGGWAFAGGGTCRPLAVLNGLSPAIWVLAPGLAEPDRNTVEFSALVSEWACSGGEPVGPRLLDPSITYTDDAVLILFAARPHQGLSTCPGIPPSATAVRLSEPLGDRRLLDAGVFPLGDPNRPLP